MLIEKSAIAMVSVCLLVVFHLVKTKVPTAVSASKNLIYNKT